MIEPKRADWRSWWPERPADFWGYCAITSGDAYWCPGCEATIARGEIVAPGILGPIGPDDRCPAYHRVCLERGRPIWGDAADTGWDVEPWMVEVVE